MRGVHQLGYRAHRRAHRRVPHTVQAGWGHCPCTSVTDVATGVYRLPWEDELVMGGRTVGLEPAER